MRYKKLARGVLESNPVTSSLKTDILPLKLTPPTNPLTRELIQKIHDAKTTLLIKKLYK